MSADRTTWRDIEIAARRCPFLRIAVEMVREGQSRQDALIAVALYLSGAYARLVDVEVQRKLLSPPVPLLLVSAPDAHIGAVGGE